MTRHYEVEQLFVHPRGAQIEMTCVLVSLAGATKRETLRFATPSLSEAVVRAARHLAERGDVDRADSARLRVASARGLTDDRALLRRFKRAFTDALDEVYG
jgi:hypothetical protein